jgi:hypothetical protein
VNFWIWWYVVKAYDFAQELFGYWAFMLNYLNLPVMASNMFVPLYQDTSTVGKFISFIIRSVWIFFGGIFMIIITIPLLAVYGLYLLLPVLPVLAGINTLFQML